MEGAQPCPSPAATLLQPGPPVCPRAGSLLSSFAAQPPGLRDGRAASRFPFSGSAPAAALRQRPQRPSVSGLPALAPHTPSALCTDGRVLRSLPGSPRPSPGLRLSMSAERPSCCLPSPSARPHLRLRGPDRSLRAHTPGLAVRPRCQPSFHSQSCLRQALGPRPGPRGLRTHWAGFQMPLLPRAVRQLGLAQGRGRVSPGERRRQSPGSCGDGHGGLTRWGPRPAACWCSGSPPPGRATGKCLTWSPRLVQEPPRGRESGENTWCCSRSSPLPHVHPPMTPAPQQCSRGRASAGSPSPPRPPPSRPHPSASWDRVAQFGMSE